MKINICILAIAVAVITSSCKKDNTITTETTTIDSTRVSGHDHHAAEKPSELMASMNDMMESMHVRKMTGNADFDLAAMMEEHHKSAVDMADILLKSGSDPEMKRLAQKIKDEQDKEIDELKKIQDKYKDAEKNYDPENTKEGLGKAMMEEMMTMMKMPEGADASVDKEFAVIMIKHHRDGIQMAKTIKQYAKDAQFKAMAQNIITSQEQDVNVMEQWLKKQ